MAESAAVAAERLGAEDGRHVVGLVADLKARGFEGRTVLVDGSQYSPSWRALDGGSVVWDMSTESGDEDLDEIYVEIFDRYTDEAGAYWEDGCLWFSTVEDEDEAPGLTREQRQAAFERAIPARTTVELPTDEDVVA